MLDIAKKVDGISQDGSTASFIFSNTKTNPPWSDDTIFECVTQAKNLALVIGYNVAKWKTGVSDNSPSSINKILNELPGLRFIF
ncbi:MAG: hypothetical protein PHF63_09155 [Herbinix sp.]|nr:hypothetical protein [Herbinix sp.]